jgi:porphobilinogen deaminase
MIKIGVLDKLSSYAAALSLQSQINETGEEAAIHFMIQHDTDNLLNIKNGLENNDYAIIVHPLSEVPLEKNNQMVIAGLFRRFLPGDCLVVQKNAVDLTQDLKIKQQSKLLVTSPIQKYQLLLLRSDLAIEMNDLSTDDRLKYLNNGSVDGLILSQVQVSNMEEALAGFEIINLNPKEIIPVAGSGVNAFLVHPENLAIRKICQNIHHKETSDVTNIERKIAQLSGLVPTNAFAYKDNIGNYHVVACRYTDELKIIRFSQSTSSELANKVHQSFH